ncbi:MAG: hypothetical protein OQJ89_09615 [Kangiellaceae bacterium]|nr:hypothetical protein [Kangiellaceae bacterium]MCW8997218.1 hypothetical protein [Kangiellaceae bacterium]MCW9017211.1 hypothetical protein [Kangiellaceae bacterium]
MDKFSAHEIKPLDVDRHIIKNQDMYFGHEGANAKRICANILESALILGTDKILVQMLNDWYLICGSPDWFDLAEIPFRKKSDLFKHICAFSEAGVNSCRFEVMVRVFSSRAFSFAGGVLETVSGEPLEGYELDHILSKTGDWSRIIGFQFAEQNV